MVRTLHARPGATTGATGKLKGIKGKGTYKGKADDKGIMVYEIEGEYELPKVKM